MHRVTLSCAALVLLLVAVAGAAPATAVLATPPIVGDQAAGEHVVCLVSNVGTQHAAFTLVAAGPFAMDILATPNEDGFTLPAGSFNAYEDTQWAGYCKLTGPRTLLRNLRLAACVAPPGTGLACRVTVDGH
jgi:hypothetical protein